MVDFFTRHFVVRAAEPATDVAGQTGRPEPRARSSTPGTPDHVRQTLDRARQVLCRSAERRAALTALFARGAATIAAPKQVVRESQALRADLRASVTAFVRRLHDAGEPPQRMVVLVKEAVRPALPPECDTEEQRALLADVVRWSIDAYYHAS